MSALDFASAPRVTVSTLHLEVSRTMADLSEMTLKEIGTRAQAAGYLLGHKGKQVTLATFIKHGAQHVYAVSA